MRPTKPPVIAPVYRIVRGAWGARGPGGSTNRGNGDMCNDPSHRLCFSRRMIITGAAALAATTWSSADTFAQGAGQPQNAISPNEALMRLMEGNARYAANTPTVRDFSAGRAARAQAQYPVAAVLSCADSRVAPEFAFDQGPGDLFVVRLAGNFVDNDATRCAQSAVRAPKIP